MWLRGGGTGGTSIAWIESSYQPSPRKPTLFMDMTSPTTSPEFKRFSEASRDLFDGHFVFALAAVHGIVAKELTTLTDDAWNSVVSELMSQEGLDGLSGSRNALLSYLRSARKWGQEEMKNVPPPR